MHLPFLLRNNIGVPPHHPLPRGSAPIARCLFKWGPYHLIPRFTWIRFTVLRENSFEVMLIHPQYTRIGSRFFPRSARDPNAAMSIIAGNNRIWGRNWGNRQNMIFEVKRNAVAKFCWERSQSWWKLFVACDILLVAQMHGEKKFTPKFFSPRF